MGRQFYLPDDGGLRIFCMYTKNRGVVAATPPGTVHIAHATYLNEGAASPDNRSNIDHFLVKKDANEEDIFGKDKRTLYGKKVYAEIANQNPSVEERYGVQFQIINEFRDLTRTLKRVTITDVYEHMKGKKDPKVKGTACLVDFVDEIPFVNAPIFAGHAEIDPEGKQTFYPNCVLDINLDIAKWCKSGISPEGKIMPWGACVYCYASFKHTGYPYAFNVDKDILIEQIKEARIAREKLGLPTRYLRLGKRTEFGIPEFREQLVATLEACLAEGISAVFPTKYLKFDKEIADLLRRTNSSLLPTQGDDGHQMGAVMHGCTTDYIFEQGILFQEAGVRVTPYVLVNPLEKDGGEVFGKNLRRVEKAFGKFQILPIVTRRVEIANRVLGGSLDLVGKQQKNLFGNSTGGYEIGTGRRGIPVYVHPSLQNRIGDNNGNIRLCLHNSCISGCGKCFLPKEKGEIIPAEKVFLKKTARFKKRERYNPQETLFDMSSEEIKQERPEEELAASVAKIILKRKLKKQIGYERRLLEEGKKD
ncbi:MAG: hypothetical protein AABX17_04175 [Nanoarchaeota archaeon]